MKEFIKKEWFKIVVVILLSIITISYASGQYVYYQKQQFQLQEIREEQKAKEEFYPLFLKIQKLKETDYDEGLRIIKSLSDEEYRIYKLLKKQLE